MSEYAYTMRGNGEQPVAVSGLEWIANLLDAELVGWFTTVSPSGRPQSSAVWFLREGDTLLMYSGGGATRIANLASNPAVSFNLRSDPRGDTVVTLEGTARVEPGAPAASENLRYLAKYAGEIERLDWTPETFTGDFPTPIRITVRRVRAWAPETREAAT